MGLAEGIDGQGILVSLDGRAAIVFVAKGLGGRNPISGLPALLDESRFLLRFLGLVASGNFFRSIAWRGGKGMPGREGILDKRPPSHELPETKSGDTENVR